MTQCKADISIDTDRRTGREVWQITHGDRPSEAVYFECQAFTADERHLVFRSDMGGSSEIWRCDLWAGELTQLTRGSGTGRHDLNMHPDGEHAWYLSADAVQRVHVPSGRSETVVDRPRSLPGRFISFPISFSADGNRVALVCVDDAGDYHLHLLDVPSLRFDYVLTWPDGFSHPMICPADRDLMTFVPNGNACWDMTLAQHRRTRTWLIDARDRRPRRFITPPPNRTVTHESWSPDGERLFYFEKTYPTWTPVAIRSVARDGSDARTHLVCEDYRLGHGVVSPDGRQFLSDVQDAGDSPLLLFDLATREREILCWPDASNDGGHAAAAHVHPSFSPTGRFVTFTSDRTGVPQVYVLPLGTAGVVK